MAKGTFEVEVVRKDDENGNVMEQLLPITVVYLCHGAGTANYEAIERVVDAAREKGVKKCDWAGVVVHVRPFCAQ